MLSISTIWRAALARSSAELLAAMAESGLAALELEYRLPAEFLGEIRDRLAAGAIAVSSLHHPCPLPDGLAREDASGDARPLSALAPEERRAAVELGRRTLDLAAELGARAVVFHLGRVEIEPRRSAYRRLLEKREIETEAGREMVRRDREERNALAGPHLTAVFRSLDELVPAAERLGVQIGIENRYFPSQIPTFEEIGAILARFPSPALGYWHDVGHAEVTADWGLVGRAADYLDAFGDRLVGVHLHDRRASLDHGAPGTGTVDFGALARQVRPGALRVLELRSAVTPAEVRRGIELLARVGLAGAEPA